MSVTGCYKALHKKTVTLQTGGVTTLHKPLKGFYVNGSCNGPHVGECGKRYNRFCNGNGIPKLKRLIFPSQKKEIFSWLGLIARGV